MPDSQHNVGYWSGGQMLRRFAPLVGAMLATVALLGATASSAAAKPVGFYLAGEKSEEIAKQPRFEAESYPATIEGSSLTKHKFTMGKWTVECGKVEFRAFETKMTGATSSLTFQPWHWECIAKLESTVVPLAFHANGCEYVLSVLNSGPPYAGSFGIECPPELGYQIIVYQDIEMTKPLCTFTFPAQTGLKSVSYSNTGTGSERAVAANLNLSGMKYTQSGSIFCKAGTFENGTLTGEELLSGH